MPSLNALHAWEKHLSSALIMFVIFCSGCCGPGNLYFLSTYKRCSTTPNVFFVTWVQYDEAVQTISLTKISHCRTFKRTSNSLPFVFATSCCSMVISPTPSKNTEINNLLFDTIWSHLFTIGNGLTPACKTGPTPLQNVRCRTIRKAIFPFIGLIFEMKRKLT